MKHLTKAIRNVSFNNLYTPIDEIFKDFLPQEDTDYLEMRWNRHILAQSLKVLREEKIYFAEPADTKEFQKLASLIKRIKETKHEKNKRTARRTRSSKRRRQ